MKRAAVIGCGALGTILVTNFARAEGWTLTGVMARTKAHAEALAANAGCRAATTLEELLADKRPRRRDRGHRRRKGLWRSRA
ncbi:MAG: Gfo/Idh/MocA family oxidoreductase [Sutterella wadsworthensis]